VRVSISPDVGSEEDTVIPAKSKTRNPFGHSVTGDAQLGLVSVALGSTTRSSSSDDGSWQAVLLSAAERAGGRVRKRSPLRNNGGEPPYDRGGLGRPPPGETLPPTEISPDSSSEMLNLDAPRRTKSARQKQCQKQRLFLSTQAEVTT
jgi:hypothetical protein